MSSLKLIVEKGPREGETLEYSCRCVIKIGRVARGNTLSIKDDGISSKHICIRFDKDQWNLSDLDSSNGTVLNGQLLKPFLPSGLNDGDCIKIGELTSIRVQIENILPESNGNPRPRRQGKAGVNAAPIVVDEVKSELGLGLGFEEGDLGKTGVEVVEKRNLCGRTKKTITDHSLESGLSCRRNLRSSRKDITENSNLNENDVIEPKRATRRGRKKELLVDESLGAGKDAEELRHDSCEEGLVKVDVREVKKATRGRKKKEVSVHESLPEVKEVADQLEESCQDGHEAVVVDESLLQEKEDGFVEGLVNDASDLKWQDFEKMTVGDFFDYLEEQLPKEIREASEKTMLELADKTKKCYELNVLGL